MISKTANFWDRAKSVSCVNMHYIWNEERLAKQWPKSVLFTDISAAIENFLKLLHVFPHKGDQFLTYINAYVSFL